VKCLKYPQRNWYSVSRDNYSVQHKAHNARKIDTAFAFILAFWPLRRMRQLRWFSSLIAYCAICNSLGFVFFFSAQLLFVGCFTNKRSDLCCLRACLRTFICFACVSCVKSTQASQFVCVACNTESRHKAEQCPVRLISAAQRALLGYQHPPTHSLAFGPSFQTRFLLLSACDVLKGKGIVRLGRA